MPRVKMVEPNEKIEEAQPEAVNDEDIASNGTNNPDSPTENADLAEGEIPESDQAADDNEVQLEDLDPELEIWPGGPTVGQTLAWKEEYGEVYTTQITLDFFVMWRPIDRNEYKQHVKHMEQLSQNGKLSPVELNMYQEESLTELCTLFPRYSRIEMSKELAGMPSIIAQQVMEASGFTALEVRQL